MGNDINIEDVLKKHWRKVCLGIMLVCMAAMIYYALMMFKMGRDPCGLCEEMFQQTCNSARMAFN